MFHPSIDADITPRCLPSSGQNGLSSIHDTDTLEQDWKATSGADAIQVDPICAVLHLGYCTQQGNWKYKIGSDVASFLAYFKCITFRLVGREHEYMAQPHRNVGFIT